MMLFSATAYRYLIPYMQSFYIDRISEEASSEIQSVFVLAIISGGVSPSRTIYGSLKWAARSGEAVRAAQVCRVFCTEVS